MVESPGTMTRPPTTEELDRAEAAVLARGDSIENLDWLAFMFWTHRRIEKARGYYTRLVERVPDNASYHFFLGEVCWAGGDRARAREHWERTVALDRAEYAKLAAARLAA